ncbi:PLATZ transcription factor [Carex littledalei]|uniref:PLATZ transcription factor n=1 Tax=Carex littledalei TaxID=544730 RepID=A0A833QEV4_9POAL|nr:PLATZ transcription factor [Carex littledalei]
MPNWLEALLGEKDFFSPCTVHETSKKNEKNIFCLDCCLSICPQCAYHHRRHRFLQIRRYMYHDVVRVEEFEKLINCSSVQSYITNSHKVIFLNERSQTSNFRTANSCRYCDRSLPDQYIYCCISCKVKELLRCGVGIARELRKCDFMPIDEGQFTSDSILELPEVSCCSSGGGNTGSFHNKAVLVPTGMEASSRRKKGIPVRAPLF